MSDFFNAFEISPVPPADPDAVAPEPFRGIYAMPMFVTVPTRDLTASVEFWTRGLGFVELFSIPGQIVHLRRWAFQDVLLVPGDHAPQVASMTRVNFACVLSELAGIAAACNAIAEGSATEPHDTPWNTRDVEILAVEGTRVVLTAAKPMDPDSVEVKNLAAVGIVHPDHDVQPNQEGDVVPHDS